MIKLESKTSLPSAVAVLELKSHTETPSVSLSTEDFRAPDAQGNWGVSATHRTQVITFIGADGQPCSIQGKVAEDAAIEISGAFKVVVEITVANELKAAYSAGRVSKAYTSLEIVRVTEVWESEKKCLWRAKDAGSQAPNGPTLGADGKIVRAA
jgi:hypothetical protein